MNRGALLGTAITAATAIILATMGLRRKGYAEQIKECSEVIDNFPPSAEDAKVDALAVGAVDVPFAGAAVDVEHE